MFGRKKQTAIIPIMVIIFGLIIVGLIPCVNAHKNVQKIAGNYEWPGYIDTKHSAIDCEDKLAAIVYARNPDTRSNDYEIKMKVSIDGGANWLTPATTIKAGHPEDQLYPDVCVVRMNINDEVKKMIFVTWQEWNGEKWEIWVRDFTANGGSITANGPAQRISEHSGESYDHARYPRICGAYLPDVGEYHSTTMVFLTYQQCGSTPAQQEIVMHYYYYDSHPNANAASWSNRNVVTPFEPETNSGDGFHHPSIECGSDYENGIAHYHFEIVCDFKDLDYESYSYSCGLTLRDIHRNQLNSLYFSNYDTYWFNNVSTGYAYPDVALRLDDNDPVNVIAYQTDDDYAYAWSHYCDSSYPYDYVDLGPCKSATMRGISVDVIEPDYFHPSTPTQKDSWENPGGITVIWRSGVLKPGSQDTYGVNANSLEIKNDALRETHVYKDNHTDDADGDDYNPSLVSHHTNNPSDAYLDISSIPSGDNKGESHISWCKNQEIWYLTIDSYHCKYW